MEYEIKKGLGAVVLAEIKRQGFNYSNFCLMVGLDRVTFRKVLDGTGNSTINTLIKISKGLDIPLSTLFERAEKIEQEMAQRRKQAKVPQKAATVDAQTLAPSATSSAKSPRTAQTARARARPRTRTGAQDRTGTEPVDDNAATPVRKQPECRPSRGVRYRTTQPQSPCNAIPRPCPLASIPFSAPDSAIPPRRRRVERTSRYSVMIPSDCAT